MKNTVFFTLTLLIISGCAHKQIIPQKSSPLVEEKKPRAMGKTRAIFHVIEPLGISLVLLNMEKSEEEIVLMDKTLSQLSLKPGHWQVSGFIMNNKRYQVMNTSKQFVFDLKKDKVSYVGSYIIQCPVVNNIHLPQMKKMSFFNRYPFSSDQRLCELVVGSDFDNVNRVWMELDPSQHSKLVLGF